MFKLHILSEISPTDWFCAIFNNFQELIYVVCSWGNLIFFTYILFNILSNGECEFVCVCVNEIVESKGSYFLVVFNVLYKYFICFYNDVKLMVILQCLSGMQEP